MAVNFLFRLFSLFHTEPKTEGGPDLQFIAQQLRKPAGDFAPEIAEKMDIANKPLYELTLDTMQVTDGDIILEIGFGSGKFFEKLFAVANNLKVKGIDFSEEMVELAKKHNLEPVSSGRLQLDTGSSDKLPFPKIIYFFALYMVLLILSFTGARAIHAHTINTLYTYSNSNEVFLSVGQFEEHEFYELIQIARSDSDVVAHLARYSGPGYRFINYVMPVDLLISEVPMYIPEGRVPSHQSPGRQDQSRYKIIYTLADFGPGDTASDLEILRRAINKTPILEVWIDRTLQQVEQLLDPPAHDFYDGMPVPVF